MFDGLGVKAVEAGQIKAAGAPEDGDLDLINGYALEPLKATDVAVYTLRVANDQVDRDGERFNVEVLHDFAATLPGKSLLEGHAWGPVGIGRFFKAWVEQVDGVTWLMAKCYLLTADEDAAEMIVKLNGGIASFVSIGFAAPSRVQVTDGMGAYQFSEYRRGPNGEQAEAIEASLVFLGAQYDAAVMKSMSESLRAARGAKKSRRRGLFKALADLIEHFVAEDAAAPAAAETEKKEPDVTEVAPVTHIEQEIDAMTDQELKSLKDSIEALTKSVEGVAKDVATLKESGAASVAKFAEIEGKVTEVVAQIEAVVKDVKAIDAAGDEVVAKVMDRVEGIESVLGFPQGESEPGTEPTEAEKAAAAASKGKKKSTREVMGLSIVPAEFHSKRG